MKRSNIRIIGVPEGEEEEQDIENLFEKIMKEDFPNLAKEIDFQDVQEAQRIPKKLDPRKHTPRHIIIALAEIKDKERILKAAREKETVTYKGVKEETFIQTGRRGKNRQPGSRGSRAIKAVAVILGGPIFAYR